MLCFFLIPSPEDLLSFLSRSRDRYLMWISDELAENWLSGVQGELCCWCLVPRYQLCGPGHNKGQGLGACRNVREARTGWKLSPLVFFQLYLHILVLSTFSWLCSLQVIFLVDFYCRNTGLKGAQT